MMIRSLGGLVVATLLLSVAACGGGGDLKDSDRALRVGAVNDASSLDPIRGNAGTDHVLLYPLYDTLISYDKGLEARPGLAESWEQKSPTELTLQLREGVTFHDGEVFNAEAVVYNFERARGEGSNVQADVASVDTITADDEYTVTYHLSAPDASLLLALADRAGMMVSPKAAEAAGGDLSTKPVGTGGWEFVEWKRGAVIKLKRYEDYWDKGAERVSAIDFTIMSDPKTRVSSLLSGQQDVALDVSPSDADGLEKASNVVLSDTPRVQINQMYLDRASEELGDPQVRKALSLAIDRETLLKSAYFNRGSIANGALPSDYWAAPPESVTSEFDPDEAKRLLAAAGKSDLSFDMNVNGDSATVRVAEILKDQWAKVGVTVNLQPLESVQGASDYWNDHTTPIYLSQWTGRPDPAMTYRLMFGADSYFNNSEQWTPGLEEALKKSDVSTEPDDRKPGLDEAAEAVFADTSFIPLVHGNSIIGLSDDVKGFENNLLGKPKFIGVTLG